MIFQPTTMSPEARWPRWPKLAAVATALLLAISASAAQAQPKPQPAQQQANPADARRVEIKRKLMAIRAYRLTEELALDEATAAKVFPLLTKYDQQADQLAADRMALNKELRQEPKDARVLDDLIRRALANRRATVDLEERRIRELRGVLTPVQTARFLVVLPEIERQIKMQIRRSMRQEEKGERPFGNRKRDRDRKQRLDPFE